MLNSRHFVYNLTMRGASIITIGDEILSGNTIDSNSSYISLRLSEIGIPVRIKYTVGDKSEDISEVFREGLRSDIIITTGGLGPTVDDITIRTIADVLGRRLVWREDIMSMVRDHFRIRGMDTPDVNLSQGYIPQGANPLPNPIGIAPGIFLKEGEKFIFMLPGVPPEVRAIVDKGVIPLLRNIIETQPLIIVTFHTAGIPESRIQELIGDVGGVSYLPYPDRVDLRLTRTNAEDIEKFRKFLREKLGDAVYGEDEDTLEGIIGNILKERGLTIAVAESLTGGLVMHRITNIPGSSDYFWGGVVAYSNRMKRVMLGVRAETLKRYGAVSEETAIEMAVGIKEATDCNIGASATGIAGPTGGTAKKPIGLVYTAISGNQGNVCERNIFKGDRLTIKEISAQKVLQMFRNYLIAVHTP